MKYKLEIEKISIQEKVALIKSFGAWNYSYNPYIKSKNIHINPFYVVEEKLAKYGLTLISLMATWNETLMVNALQPIFVELKTEGVNAIIMEETLLSEYQISKHVRDNFILHLIGILQSVGIYVFVSATYQDTIYTFNNCFGFLVSPGDLGKIKTNKPILINNGGNYSILISQIQLLSEEEILQRNRAAHAGNGANSIHEQQIDEVLNSLMEIVDTINAIPNPNIRVNDMVLQLLYQQSIVVLKNEKATLPLQKNRRYVIVANRDVSEMEVYLNRVGIFCKSIVIDTVSELSKEELNGFDAAIVLENNPQETRKICSAIKNKLVDVILIKSSANIFDYSNIDTCDALIDLFASGAYRQYQIKKVLIGETTTLGYAPFTMKEDGIFEGAQALGDNLVEYSEPKIDENKLCVECTSASSADESCLILVKHEEEIVGYTRAFIASYEKKVIAIPVGGKLIKYNTNTDGYMYVSGNYELSLNNGMHHFNLQITGGKLSVSPVKDNDKATKYKLPSPKKNGGKAVVVLFNLAMAINLIYCALMILLEESYSCLVVAVVDIALMIIFNSFVKKHEGLGNKIVQTTDTPIDFDEIFNVRPERVVKERVLPVVEEENYTNNNAVEVDLDQIDKDLTLTEQEKVIQYLKEQIDVNEYLKDIKQYLLEYGFECDNKTLKNLLATMTSSHVIFVNSSNNETTSQFLNVFGKYFSNNSYIKTLNDDTKEADLMIDSNFVQTFKYAMLETDNIFVFGFNNYKHSYLNKALSMFKPFVLNYRNEAKISDTMSTTKNLWMFAVVDENESLYDLPEEYRRQASFISLDVRVVPQSERTEHKSLNYYQFMKLVADAKNSYFLDEKEWKKIDALETYVNNVTPFNLGNKINIQIEAYTAFLKSLGVDLADCLDYVVSNKILPVIIPIIKNAANKPEISIADKLEQIFGEGNINMSLRNVKKIQIGQVNKDE